MIKSFLAKPSGGLLIYGPIGAGKRTIGLAIAADLLEFKVDKSLSDYPYFTDLQPPPGKQEIPIDAIRQLIHDSKLFSVSSKSIDRVVLVEDAQRLSEEAQNALLKILEEPPADMVFILTLPSINSVLPTIISRLQTIEIKPVSRQMAEKHFQIADNAYLISQGYPGLLASLVQKDTNHPLRLGIESAKAVLSGDTYTALALIESYDDIEFANFIEGTDKILAALHKAAIKQNKTAQARTLLAKRKFIDLLKANSNVSANKRLLALDLALKLTT